MRHVGQHGRTQLVEFEQFQVGRGQVQVGSAQLGGACIDERGEVVVLLLDQQLFAAQLLRQPHQAVLAVDQLVGAFVVDHAL